MARVVVEVMLKPEILDPQGKAVNQALARLGFDGVREVRQGKRFEIDVDGPVTDERLGRIHDAAATLLSNPVIEEYAVRVDERTTWEVSNERKQPSDERKQPSDEREQPSDERKQPSDERNRG